MNENKLLFGGCVYIHDSGDHTITIKEISPYGIQKHQTYVFDEKGRLIQNICNDKIVLYEYESTSDRLIREIYRSNPYDHLIAEVNYTYDDNSVTKIFKDKINTKIQKTDNELNIIYEETIYNDGGKYICENQFNEDGIMIKTECSYFMNNNLINKTVKICDDNGHLVEMTRVDKNV